MDVLLNECNLKNINKNDYPDLKSVYEKVNHSLEDEIIENILVNDIEVDYNFMINNQYNLDDVFKIEFNTKKINQLMLESLIEAQKAISHIQTAFVEIKEDFNNNYNKLAQKKYSNVIDMLTWYFEVLENVLKLIDDINLKIKGENLAKNFNTILYEMITILSKQKVDLLTDEIINKTSSYLKDFIDLNHKIIQHLKVSE